MKKIVAVILYNIFTLIWMFFALVFVSPLWLEEPGSKDWEEDILFVPVGFIMLVLWTISLVIFIKLSRNKR